MKNKKYKRCNDKNKYNDILHANDVGKNQMYLNNIKLYIYQCDLCNKYHLTQKETEIAVY